MPAKSPKPKSRARPAVPTEIAPGVYVGGWNDAEKFTGRRYCVLDELPPDAPADAGVRIYDDATDAPIVANLDRVADLMQNAQKRGEPVLVFCGHGIRRSPLAAAWYLHRAEGLSLDEAFDRIRAVRPKVEHPREWMDHWQALEQNGARPTRRG